MTVMNIKISDIKIGNRQRELDLDNVEKLSKQIIESGLINPITVTKDNELICGLHRLEAFKLNGETNIPANQIQVEISDDEKAIIEWAENDARAELSISERSRLFEHIRKVRDRRNKNGVNQYTKVDSCSFGHESLSKLELNRKKDAIRSQDAKEAGLGSGTSAERVKTVVNRAIPEVVKAMDNEEISISKAKNIAVMPEEEQEEALLIATGKKAKYYSDSHKKNSLEEKTLRLMEEDKYGAFSEIKIYPNNPEKSANSIAKQFKHKEPFVIMMMHLGKELIRFGRRNTTRSSEYDDYKSYSFGMTSLSDGEIYDIQEYLDNGNIKKSDICNIYNISLETLKKVEKLTKRP